MNVLWATLRKELMSYFFSPVGWLIAVLYYLYRGVEVQGAISFFSSNQIDGDLFATSYLLTGSTFFLVVLVPPILTMRSFAEEKRTGYLEVLMTAPVRDHEIVLGKWLAALVFFALLLLPTLLLLWVLSWPMLLGADLAFGPVVAGYLGLFLIGSLLLAVGSFTSSLTDNQLLASLTAMLFNVGLVWGIGELAMRAEAVADDFPWAVTLVQQVNVFDHLANWFVRGLVDTSQVVVYVVGTAFFLFLTIRSLGSRTWR